MVLVYSSVIPTAEEQKLISGPRNDLQAMLAGMFRGEIPRDMSRQVSRQVRRARQRQSTPPEEVADDISKSLDFSAWMPIVPTAEKALASTSRDAGIRSLWKFGIADEESEGRRTKRFAERWAAERSAELVGMKRIGDKLVENPNAEFAITESTRDMVRSLVVTAVRQEWSDEMLADEMTRINAFSPERAERIARTEMNTALNKGQMIAFKMSGLVTGVKWITKHDERVEEQCRVNEHAGIIEIGSVFPGGRPHPPQHPRCRCRLAAVMSN